MSSSRQLVTVSSKLTLTSSNTAAFVPSLRNVIRSIIPSDFSWWIEMDDDIGVSICWIWTGHPGVSKVGRLFDADLSIALSLLPKIDWSEQVNLAVDTVDAFEREALRAAQNKRRSFLAHGVSVLPPVTLPEPGPFTLADKREGFRTNVGKKLLNKKRIIPTQVIQSHIVEYPLAVSIDSKKFPEYAFTSSVSSRYQWCKWEASASYSDLIRILLLRDAGEVRRVILFGMCWVCPTIEKVFLHNGKLRSSLPASKILKMTPADFDKAYYEVIHSSV
jgi:hypothetical protein